MPTRPYHQVTIPVRGTQDQRDQSFKDLTTLLAGLFDQGLHGSVDVVSGEVIHVEVTDHRGA